MHLHWNTTLFCWKESTQWYVPFMATFSKRQSIFVCSEVNALMKMGRSHGVSCSLGSLIYSTLTGFTPWEDQLVKCGTNNFHPWFWTTCCTRCDSLVESRTARRSKKVTHSHYTYRNTPQTFFLGGYSNVFFVFFFGGDFSSRKKTPCNLTNLRSPGFPASPSRSRSGIFHVPRAP